MQQVQRYSTDQPIYAFDYPLMMIYSNQNYTDWYALMMHSCAETVLQVLF